MRISPINRVDSSTYISSIQSVRSVNGAKKAEAREKQEKEKKKNMLRKYMAYMLAVVKRFVTERKGTYCNSGILEDAESTGMNFDRKV